MKNNTIEIRLTSYGTLEVVTIPVKLYKDSYNVVKLRVSAVEKEKSFLKVYASDRDEAGEQVWTSATYDLPYVDKEIINGVTYNVYEDYLPQEFCAKDEVNLTFAHVVEADGVEQILTSGTLNLTIGGEGFNYNGTQIPQQDSLAIKVNKIFEGAFHYDLVINTQAEFEAFYTSLDNGTCVAKSVLFVGDGGDKVFVRQDGKGLTLPNTLFILAGINNAIIHVLNHYDRVGKYDEYKSGAIRYSSRPSTDNYMIHNLTIMCKSSKGFASISIANARNITNCICYSYATGLVDDYGVQGFSIGICNCENIINTQCYAYGRQDETSNGAWSMAFSSCENIVNCLGVANSKGMYADAFDDCKGLVNCKADGTGGNRFRQCAYLINCTDKDGTYNESLFNRCSFVNSTQEDVSTLKQYIDDKIGEVNTALTDLNSGEGV
jgi:hypothetical protein